MARQNGTGYGPRDFDGADRVVPLPANANSRGAAYGPLSDGMLAIAREDLAYICEHPEYIAAVSEKLREIKKDIAQLKSYVYEHQIVLDRRDALRGLGMAQLVGTIAAVGEDLWRADPPEYLALGLEFVTRGARAAGLVSTR